MDLNPEALRARFAALAATRAAALTVSAPLRDRRDEIARDAQIELAALDARIQAAETGLFGLDQEAALISRALGGKTGEQLADTEA